MWPCHNAGEDAALYSAVKAASDFATAYAAIDFICKPILAAHGFEAENGLDIRRNHGFIGFYRSKPTLCGTVGNNRFRRIAEHVGHSQIDSSFAFATGEKQALVAGSMSDSEQGGG